MFKAPKPVLRALNLLMIAAIATPAWAQRNRCEVTSAGTPPAVVELFTSEGCSSCPPADRWLSQTVHTPGVVALSFHVNYWDYLGWKEPFASAETTARQRLIQKVSGAPNVFTPQVVLNGHTEPNWDRLTPTALPPLGSAPAPQLRLSREGERITAQISASPDAPLLRGYWAIVQPQASTRVAAGENNGRTLTHTNVVLRLIDVPPWKGTKAHQSQIQLDPQAPLSTAFVVTDAQGVRPYQALILPKCP